MFLPPFLMWGLVGAVLAGISLGLLSVFVTQMKLSSLSFTMSHAAFAGAALGMLINLDDLIFAMLFALIVAAVLGPLADKAKLHVDVVIGALFPLTIALAFLFISFNADALKGGGMLSLIWGSILALTPFKIVLLAVLSIVLGLVVFLFYKEFSALLMNRKLAEYSGIKTWIFYDSILFLTGAAVALSLRLLGGVLIFVLMVTPAAIASQFSYDLKKIMIVAPAVGAIFCLIGFYASYLIDWPVGCTIAIISTLFFLISVFISPKRRKKLSG